MAHYLHLLYVCLHVPCSVERTPHVSKKGKGGRVSDGTEGTAQRGGDLHRRLNLTPPDAHRLGRTSACKCKYNNAFRARIHAPAYLQYDEWTQCIYPQYHNSTFMPPRIKATSVELRWADTQLGVLFFQTHTHSLCSFFQNSQQFNWACSTFIQSPIIPLVKPLHSHNLHACGITFAELHITPNDLFSNSMYLTIRSLVKQNAHALSCARSCTVQSFKRTLIVCKRGNLRDPV